jgi:hypothetical protein
MISSSSGLARRNYVTMACRDDLFVETKFYCVGINPDVRLSMGGTGIMDNALFYGDKLGVLRDHFRDETIDLIYLGTRIK